MNISSALQFIYVAVGLLAVAASVWALIFAWQFIETCRANKRDNPPGLHRAPSHISDMGRWLSWYFPIAEDIEKYLIDGIYQRGSHDISSFRDELWRKYGKREIDSKPSDTSAAFDPSRAVAVKSIP